MTKETEKKKSFIERVIPVLELETQSIFFNNNNELIGAAWLGALFRGTLWSQENTLKTRSLIKHTRVWFKDFSRENLLGILEECNKILFKIADKDKRTIPYGKLRIQVNDNFNNAKWEAESSERSLAFMIGYDAYSKSFTEEN